MIKAKLWNGEDLKGTWEFTIKLDGVRVLFTEEGPKSRKNKPLYNLPTEHKLKDCEVFLGSFKDTITAVRTKDSEEVKFDSLYSLDPLDSRLHLKFVENPSATFIREELHKAVRCGHEGLILRNGDTWLKVKPEETYDVVVLDSVEGTGRNKGRLGALITSKGKVGTGFTDKEREEFWSNPLNGETVEVSCMHLTDDGKFRHPRFIRVRYDK